MVHKPIQLNAGCPPGQSQPFYEVNSDGTTAGTPFTLPPGASFVLTDITAVPANLTSATPTLIGFGLRQAVGSGFAQRWNFAGMSRKTSSEALPRRSYFQRISCCGMYLPQPISA
jgi:hypothetical protein